MTNGQFSVKLHERSSELKRICAYFGMYGHKSDDIIQELYVIILDLKDVNKYVTNDEVNMYIVFAILKNLIYHYRIKENKYSHFELYDFEVPEEDFSDGRCISFILDEVEKVDNWFEKNIIKLYVDKKFSIRKIVKETRIDYWFVQPIIHRFKKQVQESYKKQEDDLKNQII